jgi:hypothetical protein
MARKTLKLLKSRQTVRVTPNNPSRPTRAMRSSGSRHSHASHSDHARATYRSGPPAAARGRASAGTNKSAFVRSLPSSLSAAEVIEKGKAKGIKLSAAQVYTIRANARRKGPETDTARVLRVATGKGGRSRADGKEAEFVAAALDLGLARAEALIRALRARASSGWS